MSTHRRKLTRQEIAEAFEGRDLPLAISPSELAELLGLSRSTIYEWIANERLEGAYRKRGKHLLIEPRRAYEMIFNGPEWRNDEGAET